MGRDGADQVAERGPQRVVQQVARDLDVDADRRPPCERQVRARRRRPAGQGDEQVEVVGVLHRAGAEDRVGVDDRVGLRPDDLLREPRPGGEQVRRAGVRGLDAEGHQGVGHEVRGFTDLRADAEPAPAPPVDEQGVHRRRDPHGAAGRGQPLGEGQAGRALVEAAVDVAHLHVDEVGGALEPGGLQHDPHRRPGALAVLPGEDPFVVRGERDRRVLLVVRCGRRDLADRVDDAVRDGSGRRPAQRGEVVARQPQHGDAGPEQLAGDDHAEGEDRLVVTEHEGRRGRAVHEHLDDDAAARARPAAAGDRQDLAGDARAVQRVVDVGHHPGDRVDAAHEAQRDVREQDVPRARAGDEALTDERGRQHWVLQGRLVGRTTRRTGAATAPAGSRVTLPSDGSRGKAPPAGRR